jgi:hypothetical protein
MAPTPFELGTFAGSTPFIWHKSQMVADDLVPRGLDRLLPKLTVEPPHDGKARHWVDVEPQPEPSEA